MKKFYLLFACLLAASFSWAQDADSRIIINPGRETFVFFPSAVLGNRYTVTVFLPEKAVPLSKRYPVVYLLGAGPAQAQQAQHFLQEHPALVVGVNFTEEDYQKQTKIVDFISSELIPYIDTNYLTLAEPAQRILAVRGEAVAQVAVSLAAKPELFSGFSFASAAEALRNVRFAISAPRVVVTGDQAQLAAAQGYLERAGLSYGEGFVFQYAAEPAGWFDALPLDYFLAPRQDILLRRLTASVEEKTLPLEGQKGVSLRVTAQLKNGKTFAYVPLSLRMSPPYLSWDAVSGGLRVVAGAEAGRVKIRGGVDKIEFSTKINLKNNKKG